MNETEKLEDAKKLIRCLGDFVAFLGISVMMLIAALFVSIHINSLINTVWPSVFIVVITTPVIGLLALIFKHRKTLDIGFGVSRGKTL